MSDFSPTTTEAHEAMLAWVVPSAIRWYAAEAGPVFRAHPCRRTDPTR